MEKIIFITEEKQVMPWTMEIIQNL